MRMVDRSLRLINDYVTALEHGSRPFPVFAIRQGFIEGMLFPKTSSKRRSGIGKTVIARVRRIGLDVSLGTVKFQIIALDARPGIFPRDLPPIDASHPGLAKRIDQSTQPMFAERKGVSAQRDDDIATSRADADVQRSAIGKLSGRDGNNSQIGLTHSYCESVIRRAGIHNDEFRSGRVNLPAKKSERFAKRLALIFGTQDNRYVHKNY